MRAGEYYHSSIGIIRIAQGKTRNRGALSSVQRVRVQEVGNTGRPLKDWELVFDDPEWIDSTWLGERIQNRKGRGDVGALDEALNALRFEADALRDALTSACA